MNPPTLRLERKILEQVSGLSFSYADLRSRPWSRRDDLRDLAHAARGLRDHAWRVLWTDARETGEEQRARIAALEARHRLRVRVGLDDPNAWRGAGYYPGDLASDLRTVLAYEEAIYR